MPSCLTDMQVILSGNNSFLDAVYRPQFVYCEEPMNRLRAWLLYWGILLFFKVLFFVMAFMRFLGDDVRWREIEK